MEKFQDLLKKNLIEESVNYYKDNYDYYTHPLKKPLKKKLINLGKRLFYQRFILKIFFKSNFFFQRIFLKIYKLDKYTSSLNKFYELLGDQSSKDLLLKIVSFRILGYIKVRLPLSSPKYWEGIKKIESLESSNDLIELACLPWKLNLHDLNSINIPLKIYLNAKAIYTTFCIEQYEYSINKIFVGAKEGDTVLDLGGCYGDTALYFAKKIGMSGSVYVFEFIPGNILVLNKNLDTNLEFKNRIKIIDRPVWQESGLEVFYKDSGASSSVRFHEFQGATGKTSTISIDDFVEQNKITKVDFIKTDIEGAEPNAIKGADKTIKKFKPSLAISIYHNMDDFTSIIKQIDDLQLGYKFYLGHATIYTSETVLFCKCD